MSSDHFISDMLRYKQDIVKALNDPDNNRDRVFKNDDRSKNAMIMSAMLDTCDEVVMYCGKMSVFRTDFYSHIEKAYTGAGDKARDEVKKSLEKFLDNKHRLTIILEDYKDHYLDDLISKKLKDSDNKNVSIRLIDKNRLLTSILSHTALGKKNSTVIIKRRETNSCKYFAQCLVNLGDDIANDSMTLMSYIEEASSPISISETSRK